MFTTYNFMIAFGCGLEIQIHLAEKLSDDSKRVVKLFLDWISRLRPFWQGYAAADAMILGDTCKIGGFVTHHVGHSKWFQKNSSMKTLNQSNLN